MPPSVFLVFGQDEFLVSAKVKELVEALVPAEERTFGLETVEGCVDTAAAAVTAIDQAISAVQTVGFLGGRKVVSLRDCRFLDESPLAGAEAVKPRVDALASMIRDGLPPGQVLVVSAGGVSKRYAFYKACKAKGEVHEFQVPEKAYLSEARTREHATEEFARLGLRVGSEALNAFVARVGSDTRHLVAEIAKLKSYVGARETVGADDIEAVIRSAREAERWDLADAIGARDLPGALAVLRRLLLQKEYWAMLLGIIHGRIRDLILFREALDRRWLRLTGSSDRGQAAWDDLPEDVQAVFSGQLTKDPRQTHPFRAGLLARQASHFTAPELARCRDAAVETHLKIVTTSIPPGLAMDVLLIRMLARPPARPGQDSSQAPRVRGHPV